MILFIYVQREGKGGRKTGRETLMCERNINVQEKHPSVASCTPPTGDPAHNPGMFPDRESTGNLLVRRPAFNPLSRTSQGKYRILRNIIPASFASNKY